MQSLAPSFHNFIQIHNLTFSPFMPDLHTKPTPCNLSKLLHVHHDRHKKSAKSSNYETYNISTHFPHQFPEGVLPGSDPPSSL